MAQLNIRLLGTGRLTGLWAGEADLPPACRQLLAYLLLRRDRPHARDVVATAFWGDSPEPQARRRLNTTLWRLRRTLEPEGIPRGTFLVTRRTGELAFNDTSDYWLDVDQFEQAVTGAIREGTGPLDEGDLERLEQAVGLYRGELLEGVYADWVLEDRARLANLHLAALARLGSEYRVRGDLDRSLTFTELLVAREPLREDVHRELMSLFAEAGRRAEALRQYRRCREILRRELDIEPMPETMHLARLVERGEPPPPTGRAFDLDEVLSELARAHRETNLLRHSIERSVQLLRDLRH